MERAQNEFFSTAYQKECDLKLVIAKRRNKWAAVWVRKGGGCVESVLSDITEFLQYPNIIFEEKISVIQKFLSIWESQTLLDPKWLPD